MGPSRGVALAAIVATVLAPALASAERWSIAAGESPTEVVFHSKATMESFDGRTRAIAGWIELETGSLDDGIAWDVAVDLRELDTGIGLRNQHMRENHLQTDQYPYAVFRGSNQPDAADAALVAGTAVTLELNGEFELHGVTRPRTIPVQILLRTDGALEIRAEFTVSLAEHEIPRPRFLMLKLADTQRVEFRALARPAGGAP